MGDINLPLLETTRPAMHAMDKYIGKKPHNIWSEYIKTYSKDNEIVLDMFGGSGICALEALIVGRRVISNDLSPMHSFRLETFLKEFKRSQFLETYNKLKKNFRTKAKNIEFFNTICPNCLTSCLIVNTIWDDKGKTLKKIGYECYQCEPRSRASFPNKHWFLKEPDQQDLNNHRNIQKIKIETWYPSGDLPIKTGAFSRTFLRDLGEHKYHELWSRQNLFMLSYEFDEIEKIQDNSVKHFILFAFIKSLRMCFGKMNTPRDPNRGNRTFSTSWGRSTFLITKRQVHMNPIIQFERAIEDKQGLLKGLDNKSVRMGNQITYTKDVEDFFKNEKQLLILNEDSTVLDQLLPNSSVDFILTDPPYGNTVQYFSLESVYTCWLEKINSTFKIDFENELLIRNRNYEEYEKKFMRCFKSSNNILKDKKKAVITFHHKDLKIWSLLQKSLDYNGFKKEKLILQPNLRSGETVLANPYSQTSNDYYLRYENKKNESFSQSDISLDSLKGIILSEAKEILANASEEIPKVLLEPGIMKKLFNYGYSLHVSSDLIDEVLFENIDKNFEVQGDKKKPDSLWKLINYDYQHIPLKERTETVIRDLINRENVVSFDQIHEAVFSTFADNLTPPYRDLTSIISKFADKILSGQNEGKWKLKIEERDITSEHDSQIGNLAEIGKKMGFDIWIGSVEQGHQYKNQPLSKLMNSINLEINGYDEIQMQDIKQIDLIWYKENSIKAIFEIEHSTSIISALRRGAQISNTELKRYIIIKEKSSQENLLNRLSNNPFFRREFDEKNWEVNYYKNVKKDYKNVIHNNEESIFL